MKTIIVNQKYENKRISKFILDSFPYLKKSLFYRALRQKDIRVNDKRVNEDILLKQGDHISIYITDDLLFPSFDLSIVYEDDRILVIDKPTGIEVVGEHSLTSEVQKVYPNAMPCHRLDRNTMGLILFAKEELSLTILLKKFKEKEIEKHYLAKVYGIPNKKHETLTAYLFKDRKQSTVYLCDIPKPGYQEIITEYMVAKENPEENTSILDVTLHTGRTHQIRAHLAHIGYPIIGDGKYGIGKINKEFGKTTQCLYSCSLQFDFKTDSGILNYLKGKEIRKEYVF